MSSQLREKFTLGCCYNFELWVTLVTLVEFGYFSKIYLLHPMQGPITLLLQLRLPILKLKLATMGLMNISSSKIQGYRGVTKVRANGPVGQDLAWSLLLGAHSILVNAWDWHLQWNTNLERKSPFQCFICFVSLKVPITTGTKLGKTICDWICENHP